MTSKKLRIVIIGAGKQDKSFADSVRKLGHTVTLLCVGAGKPNSSVTFVNSDKELLSWVKDNFSTFDAIDVRLDSWAVWRIALYCKKKMKTLVQGCSLESTSFLSRQRIKSLMKHRIALVEEKDPNEYADKILYHIESWIDIRSIFTPLRYDIEVRISFLEWYLKTQKQFETNLEKWLLDAQKHPYFFHYTQVGASAKKGNWNKEEALAAFNKRAESFVKLYEAIKKDGFNTDYPVGLHAALRTDPTSHAKVVRRQLYIGNGCHRLSSLLLLNKPLLREYFKINVRKSYAPRDTTIEYIEDKKITPEEYTTFLGKFYNDHMDEEHTREELHHVVAIDAEGLEVDSSAIISKLG